MSIIFRKLHGSSHTDALTGHRKHHKQLPASKVQLGSQMGLDKILIDTYESPWWVLEAWGALLEARPLELSLLLLIAKGDYCKSSAAQFMSICLRGVGRSSAFVFYM